jgi:hypothetical protein
MRVMTVEDVAGAMRRYRFDFQTANAIAIVTVIASASEAIHGATNWKDGLLRRSRSSQ